MPAAAVRLWRRSVAILILSVAILILRVQDTPGGACHPDLVVKESDKKAAKSDRAANPKVTELQTQK